VGLFYFILDQTLMATTTFLSVDPALLSGVKALEKEIGRTPLYHITRLFQKDNVQIYAKQEWQQLSGSVKARAAYRIIRHAIEQGALNTQKTLLDATSGNTGIAYAHIARRLHIPVARVTGRPSHPYLPHGRYRWSPTGGQSHGRRRP
jgi:S-sulfo-L-cysteine synthase (O-acetyl-L-serine-dependent)